MRAQRLNEALCNETRKYLKCYEVGLDASHLHVQTPSIRLHKKKPVLPHPVGIPSQPPTPWEHADNSAYEETSCPSGPTLFRRNFFGWHKLAQFNQMSPILYEINTKFMNKARVDPRSHHKVKFSNETTWFNKPNLTHAEDQE